jgi:hypothetical protein
MVLVCGTSTCHMAVSKNRLFVPGVWGPFWSGTMLSHVYFFYLKPCICFEQLLVSIFLSLFNLVLFYLLLVILSNAVH